MFLEVVWGNRDESCDSTLANNHELFVYCTYMAKPYRSTLSAPLSIKDNEVCNKVGTLLENWTDDTIAELYVTKCSAISRYLMELYVT